MWKHVKVSKMGTPRNVTPSKWAVEISAAARAILRRIAKTLAEF
jgi:hypothetical protein